MVLPTVQIVKMGILEEMAVPVPFQIRAAMVKTMPADWEPHAQCTSKSSEHPQCTAL